MLQSAYFLAKIGGDTAENERNSADKLATTLLRSDPMPCGSAEVRQFAHGGPCGGVAYGRFTALVRRPGRSVGRSGKLDRARSRLHRGQILEVNMRWKALAEIYTMHSFAPF